jgi:hypothetical protein
MNDFFEGFEGGLESPPTHVANTTPSDVTDLPVVSRALNVATTGAVRVTTVDGSVATVQIAAGVAFPVRATRVWSTGTTATGIVVMA